MSKKIEGEYRLWTMDSYISKFYKEQLKDSKFLFPEDFNSIVPEGLKRGV